QGGDEVTLLGEQFWRHRRVHAPVHAVQPPCAERAIDRRAVEADGQKLRARDDPVLAGGDEPNRAGFSSVSEGNPVWLGHGAMVGAPAVPTQRAFATTQRKKLRGLPRLATRPLPSSSA